MISSRKVRRGFLRCHEAAYAGGGFGMLTLRRWPLLVVALIVSLLIAGCGTSAAPDTPEAPGGTSAASDTPGAPGMPGNNGNNGANGGGGSPGAHGAPITIPDIIQSQGEPIDAVRESLLRGFPIPGETNSYKGIIEQCGGHLCVTIDSKIGPDSDIVHSYDQCTSIGYTDPPGGSKVYPGATIWIVTGENSCTESPSPGTESPSPGTESPSPGTESPSPGTESPSPGTESPSPGTESPADTSSP